MEAVSASTIWLIGKKRLLIIPCVRTKDVEKQIDYWRQSSEDDLEAAEALCNHRKFRQALFFLHLSVEKILKAHVAARTRDVPPGTHDLLRLAKPADLTVADMQSATLGRLQSYCLEGRYPDMQPPPPTEAETKKELDEARNICSWLANQLKQ
jgi:HEPN domain-containing protein